MLNDAFSSLLNTRWNVSPLDHLARALQSPRRDANHGPLRAWADDAGLVLELLLPGVEQESLELGVEQNVLVLRAERKLWNADSDEASTRPIERRLGLPYAVDTERAYARLENGILRLELPRADRPRRISLDGTPSRDVAEIRPRTLAPEASDARRSARVRARQAEDAYRVAVDAPGVHKDNLTLTLEGDELRLLGEPEWSCPEGLRLTHADYAAGAWTAALHVPDDVDRDQIEARVEAGVVHVTLPRQTRPTRRIEISGN